MKKLTSNQIRSLWIDYFKSKNHCFLEGKSLIPINDPSLLWINSGIATLKKYFSGQEIPPSKRLVNSQRAIRTNDIENVGITSRHHTFFEMLGNFSIGDYFKKEAIDFAYDLLVNHFQIDKKLLYFTIYEQDQNAYDLWIAKRIEASHIFKCNKDRNFWDIGQGPCGPCTEIFYDRGLKYDPQNIGIKLLRDDLSNDRYIEIWNIVFSEFNNDGKGNYTELTNKNIDTGAGLERLACISQDVPTNFDSDLFMPIIKAIESLTQKKYSFEAYFNNDFKQQETNRNFKIISDHFRACVFAIADGASPSPKDRGSIIRRLFRRSMICLKHLDILDNFVETIVIAIINTMSSFYPYLGLHKDKIIKTLENECNSFKQTLNIGYDLFNKEIQNNTLNHDTVFKLVDTYGFPFELIQDLAKEKNINIDYDAYQRKLIKHQNISRKKTNESGMSFQQADLLNFHTPSIFSYDLSSIDDANIVGLFDEKFNNVNQLTKKGWVVFNKTPFYATSGGQQHDSGNITIKNKKMNVLDVIKGPNHQHLHLVYPNEFTINMNDNAILQIDELERKISSNNHTSEHLLQHALQTLIDSNIKQKGAFKSSKRLTFDFEYEQKLSDNQIQKVEDEINNYIKSNKKITTQIMTLDEAKKAGALAYFEDVYVKLGDKLRVVTIDGLSKEICGGTHAKSTLDIEQFMITAIENKGKNLWRIEAITSNKIINDFLFTHINDIKNQINEIKNNHPQLSNTLSNIDFSLNSKNYRNLKIKLKNIKSELSELEYQQTRNKIKDEISQIKSIEKKLVETKHLFIIETKNMLVDSIKESLTQLTKQDNEHGYLLFNELENKTQYFVIIPDYVNKQFNLSANQIVKQINTQVNGSGGGNNSFAQGGTNNPINYEQLHY